MARERGPSNFDVINRDTDLSHGIFDTLEEARGAVAFDRLTNFEIWQGDRIVEESESPWHPSPECPCNICRAQAQDVGAQLGQNHPDFHRRGYPGVPGHARPASREEQYGRYIDSGPGAWDDRDDVDDGDYIVERFEQRDDIPPSPED